MNFFYQNTEWRKECKKKKKSVSGGWGGIIATILTVNGGKFEDFET